jgi:signal transduction histidine kinase
MLESIDEPLGPGSGGSEMRDGRGGGDGRDLREGRQGREGRKLIEQLRDSFQDGVDGIEAVSSQHLDRLAERGAEELAEFRDELERRRSASRSHRSQRSSSRNRRRHRSRSRGRRRDRNDDRDPTEIEHERIVRRARRRANRRIGFITHFATYLGTLAVILVASRNLRAATIVALAWGIGVFIHYLAAIAAPRLRDRWVRDEVGARSPRAVATERQRVETRSRRSMEDLSASIAHEIRNPITAAKSLVQQMGEDPGSGENLEYAEVALAELDRVERSISHLLRYARDEEPRFEAIALEDVARAAAEGLRDRSRSAGVALTIEFDREGAIRGDPEKLRRVFENLITNALDALAADAQPDPRIEILGGENLAGSEVWVRVLDTGPGIPDRDRERIWSPFHTTKETGTGLGLALSRKTVEAHGGRIELEAGDGRGSAFVLSFPKDPDGDGPQDAGDRA